jgi:hypothetical protein
MSKNGIKISLDCPFKLRLQEMFSCFTLKYMTLTSVNDYTQLPPPRTHICTLTFRALGSGVAHEVELLSDKKKSFSSPLMSLG